MRDYALELEKRAGFVRELLDKMGMDGIVYGNSGGKDCALVSIICKHATNKLLGVIMPCSSKQNYGSDMEDAKKVAEQFGIEQLTVDLTSAKEAMLKALPELKAAAEANIAPRLRMTALYAIAHQKRYLVAGTGNKSEGYMGYFTKWGDGAHDFNIISDLTVTEVYEFLSFLGAPESIIKKAPSGGLFDGQTDEKEMGVSYAEIDEFIITGKTNPDAEKIIKRYHAFSEHKRNPIIRYEDFVN